MQRSKNKKRIVEKRKRADAQALKPKKKPRRYQSPRPWYLGDDAMHGRWPGSFESNC